MSTKRKTITKAGDLRPAPYNPRTITDEKLDLLGKAMREFGDLGGIVVNVKTGNLVGGHQRLKHLAPDWPIVKAPAKDKTGTVALGTIETPWGKLGYREVSWPEAKEKQANLAANQHSGEWDTSALSDLLKGMDDGGRLLAGFTMGDMRELKLDIEPEKELDAEPQIDRAAELQKEWGTKRGQIWKLGDHRFFCADCVEVLPTLTNLDLICSDPPYGIKRDGMMKSTSSHGGRKPYEFKGWDDSPPKADYFEMVFEKSKEQCLWGANYFPSFLPASMGWLVWDKGQDICGSDCELAFTNQNRALRRIVLNRVSLMADNPNHPTQKPLALMNWTLNHFPNGRTVCDTHMGSGTTGIASYNQGRKFIGIEIDPSYFAVALQRFKDATGKTPKLIK
jgi:hypothetical protein